MKIQWLRLKRRIGRCDSHLHSLLQVPTLKARLKLQREVHLIGIMRSALNGSLASSDPGAGEIGTLSGLKELEQQKKQSISMPKSAQVSIKLFLIK